MRKSPEAKPLRQVAKICDLPYLRYQQRLLQKKIWKTSRERRFILSKDSAEAASIFAELLREDPDLICFFNDREQDVHLFTEIPRGQNHCPRPVVVKSLELMWRPPYPSDWHHCAPGPFSREENIADMSRYP